MYDIDFTINNSTLGQVLIATTGQGVRAILFADQGLAPEDDAAFGWWLKQYPHAKPSNPNYLMVTALQLVESPLTIHKLPLDLGGTKFQKQVWAALQEVTPGTTVTYQEIGRRLGKRSATRAVAQACASNVIAVAIPCHRAVGMKAIYGYRWGTERKLELLKREGAGDDRNFERLRRITIHGIRKQDNS